MPKHYSKECECQEIQTLPSQLTACEGTLVELIAIEGIWPEPCIQWQVKSNKSGKRCDTWTNIPRANSPVLSFIADRTQNGNKYRAIIQTKCECLITNKVHLTVNFIELVLNPVSRCFVAGESVTFTALAEGRPTPTVQWQVSTDGGSTWTNIPGANSSTLTFVMMAGQENNLYRAVFTNSCGTVTSLPATLFIYQEDFNLNNGGFTVVNTGTFISTNPNNPSGPWTYNLLDGQWFVNGSSSVASSALISPLITIPFNTTLSLQFNHAYNFEISMFNPVAAFDGGNVKISINGGAFTLVPLSSFSLNGYNAIISGGVGNPLSNEPAWSGQSLGWPNATITSIATLGTFSAGDVIQLEFIGGWDSSVVRNAPNWIIDSLAVSCSNAVPPPVQGLMLLAMNQATISLPSLSLSDVDAIIQQLDASIVNEQDPQRLVQLEAKRQHYLELRASLGP